MNTEKLFAIAWRATLLLLPWQTRLILTIPQLNSFPWEQATFALYVSWIPLLATIVLSWKHIKSHTTMQPLRALVVIPVITLVIASLFTSSWPATLLFWAHVILLTCFTTALVARHVPIVSAITWFMISLVPHAALGLAQFGAQHVWGSTLLGIADQPSWQSGVSVVEYGEYRLLRAYGGFPHPNVFGGWLAVGIVFLPELIRSAKTTLVKFAWLGCGALFLYALVLTFSRGAWIAAAIGLILASIRVFRRAEDRRAREALIPALILFMGIIALAVITQWPAVVTRVTGTERLEQWSLSQRTTALQDGLEAFKRHPVFGWGPGASLVGIAVARTTPSPVPLEPPHLVPFVILLETGIVGLASILALAWFLIRGILKDHRLLSTLPLLSVLAILALTDHALWTLWSGNALLILMLSLLLQKDRPAPPGAA
jgi:O-antigen ligase